jgi:hypothetical protein
MKKVSLQIISFPVHMMPLSYFGDEIWWNYEIVIYKKKRKEKEKRERVVQP